MKLYLYSELEDDSSVKLMYTKGDFKRKLDTVNFERDEYLHRSEFWRDYARVLHCPAFRRLKGKTQLFPGRESDFFRCRLTHSLEVGQIGKSIANYLNYRLHLEFVKHGYKFHPYYSFIDTDLVELVCYAHDIGHPPFGHQGESELNDIMLKDGGFEGNAQTLRILSKLERKEMDIQNVLFRSTDDYSGIADNGEDFRHGLNLTYRSLASVIKYPRIIDINEGKHKGIYHLENDLFNCIKENVRWPSNPDGKFRTVECQIMDIADDIAYSVFDLEDSFKGQFTHPLRLIASEQKVFYKVAEGINEAGKKLKKQHFIDCTAYNVHSIIYEKLQYEKLFESAEALRDEEIKWKVSNIYNLSSLGSNIGYIRNKLISKLVTDFIYSVNIQPDFENLAFSKVTISPESELAIEVFKRLTYELQISSPNIQIDEKRGRTIVKELFKILDKNNGYKFMPRDIQAIYKRVDKNLKKRIICDFIAGMTDNYAIEFYGRLKSENPASISKWF